MTEENRKDEVKSKVSKEEVKSNSGVRKNLTILSEYRHIKHCSQCGDKRRTDSNNHLYCPHSKSDCPFLN